MNSRLLDSFILIALDSVSTDVIAAVGRRNLSKVSRAPASIREDKNAHLCSRGCTTKKKKRQNEKNENKLGKPPDKVETKNKSAGWWDLCTNKPTTKKKKHITWHFFF